MPQINQEYRDYGVFRQYPFLDDTVGAPEGLFVDASVYLSTNEDDVYVWLEAFDKASGYVSLYSSVGVRISGTLNGDSVILRDESKDLYAGVLAVDEDALSKLPTARAAYQERQCVLSPSCVFISPITGVASLNSAGGVVLFQGGDGVRVRTRSVGTVSTLQVDVVGDIGDVDCEESGPPVRCIRVIQESGAPFSAASNGYGDIIINGVDSFTGEALCESTDTSTSYSVETILQNAGVSGKYSPEAWLAHDYVKEEMKAAGWFWAIAPLDFDRNVAFTTEHEGLVMGGATGRPYQRSSDTVWLIGDYSAYGYTDTDFNAPFAYMRNFTVIHNGKEYNPIRYGGHSIYSEGGRWNKYVFQYRYVLSGYDEFAVNEFGTVSGLPEGESYTKVTVGMFSTLLPFAALVPVKPTAWTPAEETEVTVCSYGGNIGIYAPNHDISSNPIKSDRSGGIIKLRG